MGIFFNPEKYNNGNELIKEVVLSFTFDDEREDVQLEDTILTNIGLPKLSNINLIVYTNEGFRVPHFHLEGKDIDPKTSKYFSSCIMLEDARYFIHNGHKSVLNAKQAKKLEKIMEMKKDDSGLTVWEYCVKIWNSSKQQDKQVTTKTMPEYSKLRDYTSV